MPRRVAAAMAARLASGSCQRLSSSVPSMSSAIRRTLIRLLYRGRAEGLDGISCGIPPPQFFVNAGSKGLSVLVSRLESAFTGNLASVAFEGVRRNPFKAEGSKLKAETEERIKRGLQFTADSSQQEGRDGRDGREVPREPGIFSADELMTAEGLQLAVAGSRESQLETVKSVRGWGRARGAKGRVPKWEGRRG